MQFRAVLIASLSVIAVAGCAPQARHVASAASHAPRPKPDWAFMASDLPVDPAYRFGKLDNGMRFVIRRNATPKGTALVRMEVQAGSLDENEGEQGYAHFVEHMAFNGSTHVPEGEMVRLLERDGLAFGADTNAQTSFEQTTYMLDLPKNDPALLDTALMLMRETASELTIAPDAVARERGVVLAEKRDRNSWQYRNAVDQAQFAAPGARYPARFPIGTAETVGAATSDGLRAFWRREYVPAKTVVVVVGDFDPAQVEAAIRARFADWSPAPAEPQPAAGPLRPADKGRTAIYIDPALSERVTASRNGPWPDEPDTLAQRQEDLLRTLGYGVLNRRLLSLARQPDPPFRGAGFGTGGVFKVGRTTNLVIESTDRKWRRGLVAAATEYRRALAHGFTAPEVAEQVANVRNALQNEVDLADTRANAALLRAVFALIRDDKVPVTPQESLARFDAFAPKITPASVLAALKREAVPLVEPLLRFQGRVAPEGGEAAIRAAWAEAMAAPLPRQQTEAAAEFAYTSFGTPGSVVSDGREPQLGIRQVRFANGVRLNIKRTDLETDRVIVQMSLDGGDRLATRTNPLAVEMAPFIPAGGLGKHSQDALQSLNAGRSVGMALGTTPEVFSSTTSTTKRDLERQLQLFAAFVTDPGYRNEGEVQYRLGVNNFFAQMRATPQSALDNQIEGILSDYDPRFTLQKVENYRTLTFDKLKRDIADRLTHGAIEVGIVGDVDEDQAIALVGRTLGALPAREADFRTDADQRKRPFTADRSPRLLRHTGAADQALIRFTWPTRGDDDPAAKQQFNMLQRVVQIMLTDVLREKLGKAYSPGASSDLSRSWDNYGTFTITAGVDVKEAPATRAAIAETIAALRDKPVPADLLERARQPLIEMFENLIKNNRGWLGIVSRAQTEPDHIDRQVHAIDRVKAVTAEQLQDLARRYLTANGAVVVTVLPEGVDEPKPAGAVAKP
ncbi:MAG: insulinase family protein [Sphingomonadales bacterium]|nr:insulinase family protein [Sphingomonadales bacterium]